MAEALIGEAPIEVSKLEERASTLEDGALCTFVGRVRRHSRGREVAYLEYNAHAAMAGKEMLRIANEAEERWQCHIIVQHRIGRIELGEASIAIVAASPHREEAFAACRHCIDAIKETVPIWKREVCPDGAYWIEGEEALPSEEG